jgi:hypothetical protein
MRSRSLALVVIVAGSGILLAGCAHQGKFATVDAFCKALPEQKVEIKGRTVHDQAHIDDTGEAVIAGCERERPKARPPEWDQPLKKIATQKPETPAATVKKRWWKKS